MAEGSAEAGWAAEGSVADSAVVEKAAEDSAEAGTVAEAVVVG